MRNRWIRSIAMLLLVATLMSLMAVGGFAAGGEETAAMDGSESAATPTAETAAPADSSEETPADGDAEAPTTGTGETTGTDMPCTVTFYGYGKDQKLKTLTKNKGETLAEGEIPTGALHWLMAGGTSELIGKESDALVGMEINTDYTFYAAYKVTYCYTDEKTGADVTTFEYVLPGNSGTNIPSGVERWTTKVGNEYTAESILGVTHCGDITFYEYKESEPVEGTVTITFKDYDGKVIETIEQDAGKEIEGTKTLDFNTLGVSGWIMQYEGEEETTSCTYCFPTFKPVKNATIYAAYYVTYRPPYGDGTHDGELVLKGQKPTDTPPQVNLGGKMITVASWKDSEGNTVDPKTQVITADTSYYAQYYISLNTSDSVAYVKGIAESDKTIYTFEPDAALTRAQAANMLYGLLEETIKTTSGPKNVSFPDVSTSSWYSEAVYHLASYGLLNGMDNGEFQPKRGVTRAEFVQMVCNLCGTEEITTASPFADVTKKEAWYYDSIMTAYQKGWITGYTQADGTLRFERQRTITRAEAVTILNRVLGRTPDSSDKTRINGYDWRLFIDLSDSHWAFYDIMEAVTGCGSSIPTTGLSAGRQKLKLGSSYYYAFVNSSGQLEAAKAGVNEMLDGKSYYFSSAGAAAPVYSAGLCKLGGDLYILNSDGSVVREPRSGYEARVYEYKNHMYYIQEDGTLLQNESYGVLYFGSNGAFTTGNPTLDSWLNWFVEDIAASSKSQEDKLYDAYVAMRDYPARRLGNGYLGYAYCTYEGTHQDRAAEFFRKARGDCSYWALAMVYVANRLGYQAWYAKGTLRSGSHHAWEVIKINGQKYLFDVEQEWGRMYGYYNSGRSDRDCWKMTYANGKYIKYGKRFAGTTYGSYWAGATNAWSPYYCSSESAI